MGHRVPAPSCTRAHSLTTVWPPAHPRLRACRQGARTAIKLATGGAPFLVSLCSPGYRLLAKGGPDLDTPGLLTCQELSERKAIASQRLLFEKKKFSLADVVDFSSFLSSGSAAAPDDLLRRWFFSRTWDGAAILVAPIEVARISGAALFIPI